jgi:hypothetical protein
MVLDLENLHATIFRMNAHASASVAGFIVDVDGHAIVLGLNRRIDPVAKEEKTAQELADMIAARINIVGLFIKVHADPASGWRATVVTAPGRMFTFQRRVEDIANELRARYDLKA